jgi:hypothetical protein
MVLVDIPIGHYKTKKCSLNMELGGHPNIIYIDKIHPCSIINGFRVYK